MQTVAYVNVYVTVYIIVYVYCLYIFFQFVYVSV
jgi:hypothetical protein